MTAEPTVGDGATDAGAPLPDPLLFAVDALSARGALVEPGEREAMAVLPPELARALSLPEELRLCGSVEAGPGEVACGLGSPLLERLLTDERSAVPLASVRLDLAGPREAQARAAVERFVVRNGLAAPVEVLGGEAVYLAAVFAFVAEADDRSEGMVAVAVEATTGAQPDEHFAALIDPARAPSRLIPSTDKGAPLESAAGHAVRRALGRLTRSAAPMVESVARRQRREQARITEYFAALVAEAKSPRRRMAPAAIEAKVAHYRAEEAAQVRDLEARFRIRLTLRPAALWTVEARVATVTLRLRRRKGERLLTLRLPAGARSLDAPPCEACDGVAPRPVLCDDMLHILCERCAPSAEGRPRCRACRKG